MLVQHRQGASFSFLSKFQGEREFSGLFSGLLFIATKRGRKESSGFLLFAEFRDVERAIFPFKVFKSFRSVSIFPSPLVCFLLSFGALRFYRSC